MPRNTSSDSGRSGFLAATVGASWGSRSGGNRSSLEGLSTVSAIVVSPSACLTRRRQRRQRRAGHEGDRASGSLGAGLSRQASQAHPWDDADHPADVPQIGGGPDRAVGGGQADQQQGAHQQADGDRRDREDEEPALLALGLGGP